jgi:hypothetical protein
VISRLSLRLVNLKLLLWEAGSSVGRALAVAVGVRWREMSPSITDWRYGLARLARLARGPCSKARLGPVWARPAAIWQHKLFHLLGSFQETGHPTNSSRRITHSLNSHQATHSALSSQLSLLTNKRLAYPALPISEEERQRQRHGQTCTITVQPKSPQPNDPAINSMATDLSPGL